MLRVAIVHPDFATKGGAEGIVLWLLQELGAEPDVEVTLFSADFGGWEDRLQASESISLELIPPVRGLSVFRIGTLLTASIHLRRRLKDFDVVNPHNYPASLWVGLAAKLSRNPLPSVVWSCNEPARFLYRGICNPHTPYSLQVQSTDLNDKAEIRRRARIYMACRACYKPLLRSVDRWLASSFQSVLTLSQFVACQAAKIYRIPRQKVTYLGIRRDKRHMVDLDAHEPCSQKFMLTVCRLEPAKNIQAVLLGLRRAVASGRLGDFKYYIVGTGPFESALKEIVVDYGLSDYVRFCGYIDSNELLSGAYYLDCQFLIYLPFDEPFGMPFLEAAHFGKASIGSSHGGPSEIILDGETGLLADPSDADEIGERIVELATDEEKCARLGRQALARAEDMFAWRGYYNRYFHELSNARMGP